MIGHVDMVGDDRIDGLVARDDAVVLPAVEAEEIDGWQINIGQESMPFRVGYGLYRTPSLAASGMPALLRHKFWLSPEKEQVQGRRFIGLLLFASERDDYRYTLQAGAELLGTVRPARRDNRRHLIVAERPIEILGGVPFTVRAEGTGPCYLEKLLFLSELPEASSFAPRLDRLSTRLTAAGTVHAARHLLRAGGGDRDGDSARGGRRPGDRHQRRLLPSPGAPVAGTAARTAVPHRGRGPRARRCRHPRIRRATGGRSGS